MPTYEYTCSNGHHFELFQKMSDKPRGKCPTCGATATRKISAGAGLVFKGSGFYITGSNFEGPAPRPLERYAISLADDGQLLVDKSRTFQEEMGQWKDPASFVPV